MLTQEEEAERAVMISGLYAQRSTTPYANRIQLQNQFSWWRVFFSGLALALPYTLAHIVYAIFIGINYQNRPDIAAMGIVFIASLILIGLWLYMALKHFVDGLSDTVVSTRPVFWFSCLSLAPAILYLRYYFFGDSVKSLIELLGGSGLFLLTSLSL
ncbi:MAG: hypothetical protein ABI716_03360, partial [Candidatus Saccharibacteria bacterium]